MKYLATMRRRDGVPMPPDVIAGMLLAQRDWLQHKVDEGIFDVAYVFAQGGGGVGIVNADSGEELSRILTSSPVFAMANIELQPLADPSALENAAHALQHAAAIPA
jgi:muconolactone delta-isomerase